MAHWIIEDHGFGGQIYMCSECRESWNDIYSDVSMEEKCPNCGAPINEDETKYVEKKKINTSFISPSLVITNRVNALQKYDEMNTTLIHLTGYDMEKLIELFAAGYTLQPPKYERTSFEDLAKESE